MNHASRTVVSALDQHGVSGATDGRSPIGPIHSEIAAALRLRQIPLGDGTDSAPAIQERRSSQVQTTAAKQDHAPPPLRFPVRKEPATPAVTLYAIQEWEGYVTEIRKKNFVARLLDLTAGKTLPHETVRMPLTEISERDAARMQPGSVFRWVIGYQRDTTGTKQRVSVIVFRDLPVMTKAKLQNAEEWAKKIRRAFLK